MASRINRRGFMKKTLAASTGSALALNRTNAAIDTFKVEPESLAKLPQGKIGDLQVSRILLGGNLLAHYTHSRDLRYVYNLTGHYNTKEKIVSRTMIRLLI